MKKYTQKQILETIYDKLANNPYDITLYEAITNNLIIDYEALTIEFNIMQDGKSYKLKFKNN